MSNPAHRITWFELPVTDLDRAAARSGQTLGVEMKRAPAAG